MRTRPLAIVAKGSGLSLAFNALNAKSHFIARILKAYGLDVTILSGIHYTRAKAPGKVGRYRGIKYFMPSVHAASTGKVGRVLCKAAYIARVVGFLCHIRGKGRRIHFVFDDNSVPLFPFLLCLKWAGVIELIFNIEEWPLAHELPPLGRLRAHAFVTLAMKCSRKVVCVSTFLADRARQYSRRSRIFKLPALAEFAAHAPGAPNPGNGAAMRFLFCGSVGYSEVIDTVIEAFESACALAAGETLELILVLHGNPGMLASIRERAGASARQIRILTSLSDEELYRQYAEASVLLAPLRPTVQDQARFPQKIAEYTSLARPIITTAFGEPLIYFEAGRSALMQSDYSAQGLADMMVYAVRNKASLAEIGRQGNAVGRRYFDYRQYVASLGGFVTS